MNKSSVGLEINLWVDCDNCGNRFDLLSETDLNEEGFLIKSACPNGYWSDEHEKFKVNVKCPECGVVISAGPIIW